MTSTTPAGAVEQVTHFHDYKAFGAMKVPTLTRTRTAGMTQEIRIAAHDASSPSAEAVALPAEIQALVE